MIHTEPVFDPLLDEDELARITGRSPSTIQKDRVEGKGPPFIRIGRQVRYRRSVVQQWLDGLQSFQSTKEAAAKRNSTTVVEEPDGQ